MTIKEFETEQGKWIRELDNEGNLVKEFLLDRKETKKRTDLVIKYLGTCSERHLPISDPPACIQCQEEENNPKHKNQSSLLINKTYMLDAGTDWIGKIEKIKPKYILLTHAHPDHAGAIIQDIRKISAEVHGPEGIREDIVELYGAVGIPIVEHPVGKGFKLDGLEFNFIPVYHSTRAPTHAIKVDGRLMYAPDFVGFKKANQLVGIELFIGDGSDIEKGIIRKNKTGHLSMLKQLEMCSDAKVKYVRFTHVGHLYTSSFLSKRVLKAHTRDKTKLTIQENYIAKDGEVSVLKANSELCKTIGMFIEPNKPAWKVKTINEIEDTPGFEYPSLIMSRIKGVPIQVHIDGEETRIFKRESGEELLKEEIMESINKSIPNGSVLNGVLSDSTIWITDMLFWDNEDLREKPLVERGRYIEKIRFEKQNVLTAPLISVLRNRSDLEDLFRCDLLKTDLIIRMSKSKISKNIHNKGWIKIKVEGEITSEDAGLTNPRYNASDQIWEILEKISTKEECGDAGGIWVDHNGSKKCLRPVDHNGDRGKIEDSE